MEGKKEGKLRVYACDIMVPGGYAERLLSGKKQNFSRIEEESGGDSQGALPNFNASV